MDIGKIGNGVAVGAILALGAAGVGLWDRVGDLEQSGSPSISSENLPSGSWCGIETFNDGDKNSIRFFADNNSPESSFAKTIQCAGHDPKVSCPDSFTRIAIFTTMIGDNGSDLLHTCVKN